MAWLSTVRFEILNRYIFNMSIASSPHPTGWRILGFGKHPEIAAAIQEKLRSLGFQATTFVLTNDEAGDARLVSELKQAEYDGVAIGGYINGQDAVNFPATKETTFWFNRVLNIIHANAPRTKSSPCAVLRTLCRLSNE
jgi:hypothetical protein